MNDEPAARVVKVAICTPCQSEVKAGFAFSLANMTAWSVTREGRRGGAPVRVSLRLLRAESSRLARIRNTLVQDAMQWGADVLLWLDSDQTFPPDTLLKLLSLDVAVAGANYPRRGRPTGPTATRRLPSGGYAPVYTTAELAGDNAVERVTQLGLGCCLIDMRVMRTLEALAAKEGRSSAFPLFAHIVASDPRDDIGEDNYFFDLLERAGVEVFVDHALSMRVGHVLASVLTQREVDAQHDEYVRTATRASASAEGGLG